MGLKDRAKQTLAAAAAVLLGVSAYQKPVQGYGLDLNDPNVIAIREAQGGQIQQQPTTRLRWYLADLERAQFDADTGYISSAAQLCRAMRRDGVLAGLLGARTAGLTRLPKIFYSKNPEISEALRAENGSRSVFDEMFPPAECAQLVGDGILLGVGVAELRPVAGRDYPVMVRLDPEYLQYRWVEDRWYYQSIAGLLPITPGDGRWILHLPSARQAPWNNALYPALGRSYINKDHDLLHRSNYSAKLANPARVAYSPLGATQQQRDSFFKRLMAWGTNTVFSLPPGYEIKLIESNGTAAYQIFQQGVDTSNKEMMVALAGQEVSTTGGSGFSSEKLYQGIREDLTQSDAELLSYTITTQGIPVFVFNRWGYSAAVEAGTMVRWDTSKPQDHNVQAQTYTAAATAINSLTDALAKVGLKLRAEEFVAQFSIPVERLTASDNVVQLVPVRDEDTQPVVERKAA